MEALKLQSTYKGYEIELTEFGISVQKDGTEIKQFKPNELDQCRKWIDIHAKEKFKRVKILIKTWREKLHKTGEATSIVDKDYVWCVDSNGNRSKELASMILIDSEANRKTLELIVAENNEHDEKLETLKKQFVYLDLNTMRD